MKSLKALSLKAVAATAALVLVVFATGFIGGPKYESCFNEYLYDLTAENKHLTSGGRMLQPGDSGKVPVYAVVKSLM